VAKRRIFTVGFELPGSEFESIEFGSNQTLLDADIILFEPTLGFLSTERDLMNGGPALYAGIPTLNQHSSFVAKKQVDHWRSEIVAAVNAGKLVIIYLAEPIERYRYTGETRYSGTGKSRAATSIVARISSYDSVPNLSQVTPKSGTSIKLSKEGAYLAPYWNEFNDYSPYEVEIEGEFSKTLLNPTVGDRIVGAAFHGKAGTLLFLPPLRYDDEEFIRDSDDAENDESYWTDDALKFGKRLVSSLVALADTLKNAVKATPPPDWSTRSKYRLTQETVLEAAILKCASDAAALLIEKERLESELLDVGGLRRLLFEQGSPLEGAVLDAMRLLGFDAKSFADGESEFDGIFVCPEGRCLGEVEGKDSKAVNIEKFGQLERNIQEDFARDEVTEYAKGILFGNAYRLAPIEERGEFFTAKCLSAAKRIGAALIRTPDLFVPTRYLKESPSDAEYALKCRQAIFATTGAIVIFPRPPVDQDETAVASHESRKTDIEADSAVGSA
jgi:hypothetical protein